MSTSVNLINAGAPTALVVGVTGRQGGATAQHLIDAGWHVRGLTRDLKSRRARASLPKGIQLVKGNLEDRPSLASAMSGVDGVFGVTPMDPRGYSVDRELRQGTLLAEAAVDADVSCFVFSSVAGAQDKTLVPHIEVKGKIEDRIRALGLRATILRPNIFMENLVDTQIAPVYWRIAPALIGWDKPLAWVTTSDVGTVAARVMQNPERWKGQTLEIVGDRKSLGDALRIYREIMNRKPFRLPMPVWVFRRLVGEELVTMWKWQGSSEFGSHSTELQEMAIEFTGLEGFLRKWSSQARRSKP